jgi:hypothetical protein
MSYFVHLVVFGLCTLGQALISHPPLATKDGANGVIVYKVNSAFDKGGVLFHSLCLLNAHFNGVHNYPIVIFSNGPLTDSEKDAALQMTGNANVTFAESEFYSDFFSQPDGLPVGVTNDVKRSILDKCPTQNGQPLSSDTTCNTTMGHVKLGYIWMNVWTYHYMWREPALSSYDYYVYVDSDALVMSKWKFDPFKVMRSNNLKFIFNQYANSGWEDSKQVVPIAKEVFGDLGGTVFDRALDQSVFNDKGEAKLDSWGGWFSGGDLRAFRSEKYHDFTRRVLLSGASHTARIDQQVVMTIGIAKLAQRDQIWSLPAHGYPTSMFHTWFFDSSIPCILPNGTIGMVEGTKVDSQNEATSWPFMIEMALDGKVINKKGKVFSPEDIEAGRSCQTTIRKLRGEGMPRVWAAHQRLSNTRQLRDGGGAWSDHQRWDDKCYEEYSSDIQKE